MSRKQRSFSVDMGEIDEGACLQVCMCVCVRVRVLVWSSHSPPLPFALQTCCSLFCHAKCSTWHCPRHTAPALCLWRRAQSPPPPRWRSSHDSPSSGAARRSASTATVLASQRAPRRCYRPPPLRRTRRRGQGAGTCLAWEYRCGPTVRRRCPLVSRGRRPRRQLCRTLAWLRWRSTRPTSATTAPAAPAAVGTAPASSVPVWRRRQVEAAAPALWGPSRGTRHPPLPLPAGPATATTAAPPRLPGSSASTRRTVPRPSWGAGPTPAAAPRLSACPLVPPADHCRDPRGWSSIPTPPTIRRWRRGGTWWPPCPTPSSSSAARRWSRCRGGRRTRTNPTPAT